MNQSNKKRNPPPIKVELRIFLAQNIMTFIICLCVACFSASTAYANLQIPLQNQFKNVDLNLRAKIAQKIMIDLRYYCSPQAEGRCQQSMLSLPAELESMLYRSKVGGVILFKENLVSSAQIIRLNHQLQMAAIYGSKNTISKPNIELEKTRVNTSEITLQAEATGGDQPKKEKHKHKKDHVQEGIPLYIGIDQEGGQVSRLPQNEYLGFAGNMAIGATFAQHKNEYASIVASRTADYLLSLGINLNFAPVLDVNNNPENPIINVRSYAQSPEVVASLGGAAIASMQQKGISVAAKHFPGHGDTFIDSHLGLPRVEHTKEIIDAVDLFPFKQVISHNKTSPDMIMTAHIQYPNLDNTSFVPEEIIEITNEDQAVLAQAVLPATLSEKILTDLLRDEMGYEGLIITDALNMASITKFLTPTEAVIKSFKAGADITLMPFHISSSEDAIRFLDWLNEVTIFIAQDPDLVNLVEQSYHEILRHKKKRNIGKWANLSLEKKLISSGQNDRAEQQKQDEVIALNLSKHSFTKIKGLPKALNHTNKLLVVMPDKLRCNAFTHYWTEFNKLASAKCISMLSEGIPLNIDRLDDIDTLIVGDAFPTLAFYESKEYENIEANERLDHDAQQAELKGLINQAHELGLNNILVKLRSPYVSANEIKQYNAIYATYDYQVSQRLSNSPEGQSMKLFSPAFASLVKVLLKEQTPMGTLPVSLSAQSKAMLALPANPEVKP